jgi:2,3-bisphosphoglycerate-dependent phosphoglycerate mutase
LLNVAHLEPEVIYTSELRRTKQTADILLARTRFHPTTITSDWRLDERNYGALTGLSKSQVLADYGEHQFHVWRRSVDSAPLPMGDDLYMALKGFPPFDQLPPQALTRTESLGDVMERIKPFLADVLVPDLLLQRTVLVVAHGNSLRALCGILDSLDDEVLEQLNIPTGQPLVYKFDKNLAPDPRGGAYLDPQTADVAATKLAGEGGT